MKCLVDCHRDHVNVTMINAYLIEASMMRLKTGYVGSSYLLGN